MKFSPLPPLLTLSVLSVIGQDLDEDYCHISPGHTLCRSRDIGQECGQVGKRGLSREEQDYVTDYHNRLRSKVSQGLTSQPGASNMLEFHWDPEMARIAQRLADQCVFDHDCSQCRSVRRFKVGQNLYISYTTRTDKRVNWKAAMDGWFNEIDIFPVSSVTRYNFSKETGHYSQMVWADTDRIGCGVTQFPSDGWIARLYVCNYGSAGNILRTPVYSVGPPCSSCPSSHSCSFIFPGLCSSSNQITSHLNNVSPPVNQEETSGLGIFQDPSDSQQQAGPSSFPFPYPADSEENCSSFPCWLGFNRF